MGVDIVIHTEKNFEWSITEVDLHTAPYWAQLVSKSHREPITCTTVSHFSCKLALDTYTVH
jgi:hypothetical protein